MSFKYTKKYGDKNETGHGYKNETGHGHKNETGHGYKIETGHGDRIETGHGDKLETGHGNVLLLFKHLRSKTNSVHARCSSEWRHQPLVRLSLSLVLGGYGSLQIVYSIP